MLDPNTNTFQLVYGERWSGEKELAADLTLLLENDTFQQLQDFAIGDIDGDTFPELMLSVASFGGWDQTAPDIRARPGIYLIRGTGDRLTGTRQLTADYRWSPPTETGTGFKINPEAIVYLKLAGDIDGDGSQDILTMLMDPTN